MKDWPLFIIRSLFVMLFGLSSIFSFQLSQNAPITVQNVNNLDQVAQLGRGEAQGFAWSRKGDKLLVLTEDSIWQYQFDGTLSLLKTVNDLQNDHFFRYATSADYLAVIASSTRISIYNIDTLAVVAEVIQNTKRVSAIAFVPNTTWLILGNFDGLVQVWDFSSGLVQRTFNTSTTIYTIAVSPDGTRLAVGGHEVDQVQIWRIDDFTLENTLLVKDAQVNYSVERLTYTSDGKALIVGRGSGSNANIHVFNLQTGTYRDLPGVIDGIHELAVSRDGHFLAAVAAYRMVVWDLMIDVPTLTVYGTISLDSIAFHPTQPIAVVSSASGLNIVEIEGGNVVVHEEEHFAPPMSVTISTDGKMAAAVYHDGKVRLWNLETLQLARVLFSDERLGGGEIRFSPDNKLLAVATGTRQNIVFLLDAQTGRVLRTFDPYSSYDVAFTPNGDNLLVSDWGRILAYNIESGVEVFKKDYGMGSSRFILSKDGRQLAVTLGGTQSPLSLIDTSTWKTTANWGFFSVGEASTVTFDPTQPHLASIHGATINIWNISSQAVKMLNESSKPDFQISIAETCPRDANQLYYNVDGTLLIYGCGDLLFFMDATTHLIKQQIRGRSIVFSKEGNTLVAISGGVLRVWRIVQ